MANVDLSSANAIVTRDLVKKRINNEKKYTLTGYSKMILDMKEPIIVNQEWSRKIELQESIDEIYNFFQSIDINLANQFNNLIHATNNGKPIIKFNYCESTGILNSKITKDGVYINYNNTPGDLFTIAHEVLHFMNLSLIYEDDRITESRLRNTFGEANSILCEYLLKDYLISNHIITTNDFKLRYIVRLSNAKKCVKSFIIEKLLIEIRESGLEINYDNLLDKLESLDPRSIDYQVLANELNSFDHINKIIKNNKCNGTISKKYIYGLVIADALYKSDNRNQEFINLNDAICSVNKNVEDEFVDLRLRFPHI